MISYQHQAHRKRAYTNVNNNTVRIQNVGKSSYLNVSMILTILPRLVSEEYLVHITHDKEHRSKVYEDLKCSSTSIEYEKRRLYLTLECYSICNMKIVKRVNLRG